MQIRETEQLRVARKQAWKSLPAAKRWTMWIACVVAVALVVVKISVEMHPLSNANFAWLAGEAISCGLVFWVQADLSKRRRRVESTICPTCGYDLRATPDRCPECGTKPQSEVL